MKVCVVCNRLLLLNVDRAHVDTCGEVCYRKLLAWQRSVKKLPEWQRRIVERGDN